MTDVTVSATTETDFSVKNKRSPKLPKSRVTAADDAEPLGEPGATASFAIVGFGASAGGLDCERVSK